MPESWLEVLKSLLRYLREVITAYLGSVTVASLSAPFVFVLLKTFLLPELPSRGYVIILPYFPVQICSAIVVALTVSRLRPTYWYAYFAWVPWLALLLVYAISMQKNGLEGLHSKIAYLLMPPFKMEQLYTAIPFYTSCTYCVCLRIFKRDRPISVTASASTILS